MRETLSLIGVKFPKVSFVFSVLVTVDTTHMCVCKYTFHIFPHPDSFATLGIATHTHSYSYVACASCWYVLTRYIITIDRRYPVTFHAKCVNILDKNVLPTHVVDPLYSHLFPIPFYFPEIVFLGEFVCICTVLVLGIIILPFWQIGKKISRMSDISLVLRTL